MTDQQVMHEMAQANKDIRLSTTFVELKKVKQGALISFGVDEKVMNDVLFHQEEYYLVAYIINKKDFDEIKNTL